MADAPMIDFAHLPHPAPVPSETRDQALVDPGFGSLFTDHMVTIRFDAGRVERGEIGWHDAKLCPREPIPLDPAAAVLHYAQEIFEGMKAYRWDDGTVALFRPEQNARRLNASARRMAMPELPEELFMESIRQLVAKDRAWMPTVEGGSLYLRPFMFATEAFLGVRPAREYLYCLIASPVGSYFKSGVKPVDVWVSRDHTRAAPGGTGAAKAGGNYAASLVPLAEGTKHGCQQTVFLDAIEKKWVEELGGMNLFFVFADPAAHRHDPARHHARQPDPDAARRRAAGARGALFDRPVACRCAEGRPDRNLRLWHRCGRDPGRQRQRPRWQVHDRHRRHRAADAEAARQAGGRPDGDRTRSARLGDEAGLIAQPGRFRPAL